MGILPTGYGKSSYGNTADCDIPNPRVGWGGVTSPTLEWGGAGGDIPNPRVGWGGG